MQLVRGDTFQFDFFATLEDDGSPEALENYAFIPGDRLKIGIKTRVTSPKYLAYKEIEITEKTESVPVEFAAEEMKKMTIGDKILEVELTDTFGDVRTIYQEKIKIVGDVINE